MTAQKIRSSTALPELTLSPPVILHFSNSEKSAIEEESKKHAELLQNLLLRVDCLLSYGKQSLAHDSVTLQACLASLHTRMPLVLRQTEEWVERGMSPKALLVCKLRSTLALFRADQYLDRIQEAIDPCSNRGYDEQLRIVLAGLETTCLSDDFKKGLAFRISPWVPSTLCFDLPVGSSARASFPGNGAKKLPISLDIEPVVEFRAEDRVSVTFAHLSARACQVTIVDCKHVARKFDASAGVWGEATIRVLIAPLDCAALEASDGKRHVWGCDSVVKSLQVKEARA
jgi:hypothetical protein